MSRKTVNRVAALMNDASRTTKMPTVLCIDDDPQITDAIARRLRRYNVEVVRAFHGMQGYWMAVTEKPDVIITDLRMPQGDGETVLECLKRNTQTAGIPVVVLTGVQEAGQQRRLEHAGAAGYLNKPVRFEDLLEELGRHIPIAQPAQSGSE